jgi:hypothetical protein
LSGRGRRAGPRPRLSWGATALAAAQLIGFAHPVAGGAGGGSADAALLRQADAFVAASRRNFLPELTGGIRVPDALPKPPTPAQARAEVRRCVLAYAGRHHLDGAALLATEERYDRSPRVRRQFPDYTLRAKYLIGAFATVAGVDREVPLETSMYQPFAYDATGRGRRIAPDNQAQTLPGPRGTLLVLMSPLYRRQPIAVGASSLWHEILTHERNYSNGALDDGLAEEQAGNAVDKVIEAQIRLDDPGASFARTRLMQAYNSLLLARLNSRTGTSLRLFRASGEIFPGTTIHRVDYASEVAHQYRDVPRVPTPGNVPMGRIVRRIVPGGLHIAVAPRFGPTLLDALDRGVRPAVLDAHDIVAIYRQLGAHPPVSSATGRVEIGPAGAHGWPRYVERS